MNFALIFLWFVVLGMCALLVYISIITQIKWYGNKANLITALPAGKCIVATNSVPDVSKNLYCVSNGTITGYRYSPSINLGSTLTSGVVISTTPTYYGTVCAEFCPSGLDPSKPGTCNGGIGQDDYVACIKTLQPVGCKDPALPVGYDNVFGNFYYATHIGNATCQTTAHA
jgi:hypothetical protein